MARRIKLDDQGNVQFFEAASNGTNKATVQAPATLAADYTLTLPVDDGAASQFLQTDGSGVLSWANSTATLQSAYDNGAKIDADGTQIEIEVAAAQGNVALLIDQDDNQHGISITKDGTGAGSGVNIVNAGTGDSLVAQQTSTGRGVFINQDGAGTALDIDLDADAKAINVDVFASSTNNAVHVLNAGTGKGLFVDQDGAAIGVDIDQDGAAIALQVNQGTANAAVDITQQGAAAGINLTAGAAAGFVVGQANNNRGISLTKTGTGAGEAVYIENDGTGIGVRVKQDGAGVGLQIEQNAAAKGLRVLQTGGQVALELDSEATSSVLLQLSPVVTNTRGDIGFGVVRTSDPSGPAEGDAWYNSTDNLLRVYDGNKTVNIGTNHYETISDPGDAGTITPPSNSNFECEFTNSTGSQTRVLGSPAFVGQRGVLKALFSGGGTDTSITQPGSGGWQGGGVADDVATWNTSGEAMEIIALDTTEWRESQSWGVTFA